LELAHTTRNTPADTQSRSLYTKAEAHQSKGTKGDFCTTKRSNTLANTKTVSLSPRTEAPRTDESSPSAFSKSKSTTD